MSAYVTVPTPMLNLESLLLALQEMGFPREAIEVHDRAARLVGYLGDLRSDRAHVVIRRRHVGPDSNDIGFLRTETGFRAIVSDYDRRRFGPAWFRKLHAAYGRHEQARLRRLAEEARRREEQCKERAREATLSTLEETLRARGYRLAVRREGKEIRVVARKRVFR